VEEEFFILPASGIVSSETYKFVDRIVAALGAKFPHCAGQELIEAGAGQKLVRAEQELFKLQVELKTTPCTSIAEVQSEILEYRRILRDILAEFDFLAYASSTHPTQDWRGVPRKQKELHTLAFRTALASEMAVCGMHVHLGVPDLQPGVPDRKTLFDLFNFLRGFLPLFLSLSTSSAFWRGEPTGLLSYRPSIFGTVPRGGLPPLLSQEQFTDYLDALGRIEDQGELIQAHWFLRPSAFWPTVEVRIMDMCPCVDDAMAIAALIASLAGSYLSSPQTWEAAAQPHAPGGNMPEPLPFFIGPPQHLLAESIWRVQKHGLNARILGESGGKVRDFPLSEALPVLADELSPIADRLGCREHLQHLSKIPLKGTSSERQIACYEREKATPSENPPAWAASRSILHDFGY
jgi:carboxylate-amine ligase